MTRHAVALTLALTLAASATACVAADEPVLTAGPTLTTCAAVMTRASDLQACDFDGVCSWSDPANPAGTVCCSYYAVCNGGRLLVEPSCSPDCTQTCLNDAGCPTGAAWCDGTTCVACPDPAMCPPCPTGTMPVLRNGCPTCTCAPPSECAGTDPNTGVMECDTPQTGEVCYRGQVCTAGCAPGEPTCCANVCAAPGCSEPAPQGCRMDCPTMENCPQCMATDCTCNNGVWQCTPVCSDVVGPCFHAAT
jgi:hypothetical protein